MSVCSLLPVLQSSGLNTTRLSSALLLFIPSFPSFLSRLFFLVLPLFFATSIFALALPPSANIAAQHARRRQPARDPTEFQTTPRYIRTTRTRRPETASRSVRRKTRPRSRNPRPFSPLSRQTCLSRQQQLLQPHRHLQQHRQPPWPQTTPPTTMSLAIRHRPILPRSQSCSSRPLRRRRISSSLGSKAALDWSLAQTRPSVPGLGNCTDPYAA